VIPVSGRDFFDGVALVVGGVVDQHVDGAEVGQGVFHRGLEGFDVGEIAV
jgi:hypothetical protein